MKKILFAVICSAGLVLNVQASSVATMKIFTGDHGGVVTVHKQVNHPADEDMRTVKGRVTVSDVRLNIMQMTAAGDDAILDEELPLLDDAVSETKRADHARVSGRVRFMGEQDAANRQLTVNGQFKSLVPQRHTLELQEIIAEVVGDELSVSGTIIIDGREFDINAAPDATQKFVRRLIWLIRKS